MSHDSDKTASDKTGAIQKLLYTGILKASECWPHPVYNWNLMLSTWPFIFQAA